MPSIGHGWIEHHSSVDEKCFPTPVLWDPKVAWLGTFPKPIWLCRQVIESRSQKCNLLFCTQKTEYFLPLILPRHDVHSFSSWSPRDILVEFLRPRFHWFPNFLEMGGTARTRAQEVPIHLNIKCPSWMQRERCLDLSWPFRVCVPDVRAQKKPSTFSRILFYALTEVCWYFRWLARREQEFQNWVLNSTPINYHPNAI